MITENAKNKIAVREKISADAVAIKTWLGTKSKVPECIVNGTLQDVYDYKDLVEEASSKYHVQYNPGKRMSLKELQKVSNDLGNIFKKLTTGER